MRMVGLSNAGAEGLVNTEWETSPCVSRGPLSLQFQRSARFKSTLRTKPLVLVVTLVLDVGGKMNHKLSSRFESVDFEGAAKLADS
jgi:hypothetical protein